MTSREGTTAIPALGGEAGPETIWATLRDAGAVLVKGAASTPAGFEALTERFASGFRVHQDPTRRRYSQDDTTQGVTGGRDAIGLHAERAYLPGRPELLFFCCLTPPESGGATTCCDGAAVVARLPAEDVERWQAMRLVWHTTQDPRMWQRLWNTEDANEAGRRLDEAVERAGERDQTKHWFEGDVLHVDYGVPALGGGWIGARPAFANYLLLQELEPTGPRATLPDGTPIPRDLMQRVTAVAEALTIDIPWEHGDVALIDNTRCMHGRRALGDGVRQILVRMGDALPHLRNSTP